MPFSLSVGVAVSFQVERCENQEWQVQTGDKDVFSLGK